MRNKAVIPAKAGIQVTLCVLFLSACQKHDRLSAPTQILRVSPTVSTVKTQTTKTFTATLTDGNGAPQDALPTWSISPASAGTLSPATGLQSVFTASQVLGAHGTITVSYNGLVGQAQVTVTAASTGNPATDYGFFSESLPSGMKFDSMGPDGGVLGVFPFPSPPITLQSVSGAGQHTEGAVGLQASVSPAAFTGYFMQFGSTSTAVPTDMSRFGGGQVCLDARVPFGADVRMKLASTGAPGNCTAGAPNCEEVQLDTYITYDDFYHSFCVPMFVFTTMGGVNLIQFEAITFTTLNVPSPYDFYVDNLRFEL